MRSSWVFSFRMAWQSKCKISYFWSIWQFHHVHQPDSKPSQNHFKLAVQAKWTSTFIAMLWGIAGYSLLRRRGSPIIFDQCNNFITTIHIASKQSYNNFWLALQTEWTPIFWISTMHAVRNIYSWLFSSQMVFCD